MSCGGVYVFVRGAEERCETKEPKKEGERGGPRSGRERGKWRGEKKGDDESIGGCRIREQRAPPAKAGRRAGDKHI